MAATHKKQLTTTVRPGSLLSNQDIIAVVSGDTDIGGRIASVNDLRFSTAAGLWLEWMPIASSLVGGSLTATFRIVRPTILSSEDLVTEIHYGGTPDGSAPGPSSTLSVADLLGGWDLESLSPADWSGNFTTATTIGLPSVTDGKVGQAIQYSGDAQYTKLVQSAMTIADRTFAAWVKPDNTTNNLLFCWHSSYGYNFPQFFLNISGSPWLAYASIGYVYFSATAWTALSDGGWHALHLYCGSTVGSSRLWVDGEEHLLSIVVNGTTTPTATAWSLSNNAGSYGCFDGSADDVRVWSGLLSDARRNYYVSQVNSPGTWGPEIATGGTSIYRPTWGRGLRRGARPVYGGLFTRR